MASSIGSRDSVSFLLTIQATGLLTFTLVGLTPTEYASLRWTHLRAGSSRRSTTFFSPGLEVVAFEQHPYGFTTNLWNRFSLDRLLHDQPYGPVCLSFRRVAAHHGDVPLPLDRIQ